jgi:DNA-binding MarR family transcriptional regulator
METVKPTINYEALAAFRYEIRRFLNFTELAAREAGVEPQQHQALLAIKGLPATQKPTIGVLAERLQIRHHSAVELTHRLESRGMIRRSRNENDLREVLLQLTPKGEQVLDRISARNYERLASAGADLIEALTEAIGGRKKAPGPSSAEARASRRGVRSE